MTVKETRLLDYVTEEALFNDPYPVYDRLRQDAPLYWHPDLQGYLATRWEDCERILNDPETFPSIQSPEALATSKRAFGGDPTVLSANGPVHTDLRKAVDGPLRPKAVRDHMDMLVRPVVKEKIAALSGLDRTELMATYFEPISVRALGHLLGLHHVDDDTLRRWFAGIVSGLINVGMEEEGFAASDQVGRELAETFPFGAKTPVFKVAGKTFALSQLAEHPLRVSLKCEPQLAEQQRATWPSCCVSREATLARAASCFASPDSYGSRRASGRCATPVPTSARARCDRSA